MFCNIFHNVHIPYVWQRISLILKWPLSVMFKTFSHNTNVLFSSAGFNLLHPTQSILLLGKILTVIYLGLWNEYGM